MGRQVVRKTELRSSTESGIEYENADQYMERLLKLIPSETIALYLFLEGVVRSAMSDDPERLSSWLWSVFIVVVLANLLYLWRGINLKDPMQYIVMTCGLGIWVLTIGGPFALTAWYEPFIGSVALALFTFMAPLVYTGVESSA